MLLHLEGYVSESKEGAVAPRVALDISAVIAVSDSGTHRTVHIAAGEAVAQFHATNSYDAIVGAWNAYFNTEDSE